MQLPLLSLPPQPLQPQPDAYWLAYCVGIIAAAGVCVGVVYLWMTAV
jgi:hypothetical protein